MLLCRYVKWGRMNESDLVILIFFVGSLQGICALVLAHWEPRGQRSGRAWFALAWCALACAAFLVFTIIYPESARLLAYLRTWDVAAFDRPGQPRGSVPPSVFVVICALIGALVPLWTVVAILQYWPGRAYRAALRATLLPSAIIGLLSGVWLMGVVLIAILLAFLTLLQRFGW